MIDVIPITQTVIDWRQFNDRVCDYLDRSPYATLREPACDFRTFLLGLGRLSNPASKDAVSEAFDHLSFGFLLHGDANVLLDLVSRTKLRILIAKSEQHLKTAIVSGTLKEYKDAIQDHLQRSTESEDHRQFYNLLMLYFEHLGLGLFWQDWLKRPQLDGTFLLEHKV